MILIRLLPLLLTTVVCVAIFNDAHKRINIGLSITIAVLCGITFPIGPLLYYMFIRTNLPVKKITTPALCPRCGFSSKKQYNICPKCNNSLKIS